MPNGKNSTVKQAIETDSRIGRELFLLIDEFEEFLDQRARIPLTGKLMIDEDDIYGFVDHLRRAIPAEINRAMEILAQRERIIREGEAEAEALVAEAKQYAQRLTDESAIARQAEEEAARILNRAYEEANALRRDADSYAAGVLSRLEEILTQAVLQVQEGQRALKGAGRDDAEDGYEHGGEGDPGDEVPAAYQGQEPAR